MNNKPKFRFDTFEGFSGEWKSNAFSTIVERVSKQSNSDSLPKLEFEDIISGEGRLNKDISEKFDNRKGIIFEPGYILFGKLRPYLKKWLLPKFNGIALGDFWVFTTKHSPEFVYSLIQTDKFQTVANLSTGTKMPRSDWKTVSTTDFLIPAIDEQKKIGSFFKSLDETISLHQQELEALKQTKQGFLQKMFPKDEENIPEIRFPEFKGDWKLTTLGEIAEIVRGASPRPIQNPKWFDNTSEVGWLRIADVTEQNGRIHRLEQRLSIDGQSKTRVLTKPHLMLSIAATVGKPVINYISTGVHDGFLIFKNPQFDIEFMFQWLEMFRLKWSKYGQPGSQVNLNSELVRSQPLHLPTIKEQIKIREFFRQMDEVIELKEKELEALKETKKGFLQKMFV